MKFEPNSVTTFTYTAPKAHDRYPKVLVLAEAQDRIHALNLNRLTDTEKENLKKILVKADFADPDRMYEQKLKNVVRNINSYRVYRKSFIQAERVLDRTFV